MREMFFENSNSEVLKQKLLQWCMIIEKIGRALFWFLLVLGIVDTIVSGYTTQKFLEGFGIATYEQLLRVSDELGVQLPSLTFVVLDKIFFWLTYLATEYGLYKFISIVLGTLATIVQQTKREEIAEGV